MHATMRISIAAMLVAAALAGDAVAGTIVRFKVSGLSFDVELYDDDAPQTVANFLSYVEAKAYDNSIFHRSTTYNQADIQIVQGGGYGLTGSNISEITTNAPIPLEAGLPNLRGTIAMARLADPNSATSGWFFNVEDNPGLDDAYAVFGRVIGDGINVIDLIGDVPAYNASAQLGPTFTELPLLADQLQPQNLVLVESVAVVPEPSTLLLAAVGIGLALARRK